MTPAEHCHALLLRPAPADVAPDWSEVLPYPSGSDLAGRRRAAELSRPAASLRAVRLDYSDGVAELVLTAPRSAPLRGRAPFEAVAGSGAAPDWGLGDGRSADVSTYRLVLPAGADLDPARWRAALAAVLDRYGSGADAVGLLLDVPGGPAGEYVPCLAPPYPLTLSVVRTADDRLQLRADHRLRDFSAGAARWLVDAVADAYNGTTGDWDERITAVGRPTAELVTEPLTVPAAFARVAAAQPDAPVVGELSYAQLAAEAGRIAGGLRARGVEPGDRVGVCLDRTVELVAALLGVLRAGAVYVPLDPAYPVERLAFTLADSGAATVLTRRADLPGAVSPDSLAGTEPGDAGAGPDDPAYIIYTSGSSGRPKGVLVPHRNVVALIDATRAEYGLGPGEVWTLFHSSAFDFSVWEIWGCLLTGGRLVVVPYETTRDPERFGELLAAERVTVLSQTPSAFSQLTAARPDAATVRLVVFGGEPLDARTLLPWLDRYPACRLVNMFGITETTVHVTAQTVDRGRALARSRSVGPALPGWRLYVVDPAGRLAPPGVLGEICVAGAGVALGYVEQPELTADRFVPDPYGPGVMYRSGDQGRLLPDGRLEHHGRIDGQVKIRGFRIEPDEIRAVLLEDPGVAAAAVTVRRTDPDDAATARIDGYVVLAPGGDAAAARRRCAELLPEHMVPATVTALPAFPLTGNGKLDVAALPLPGRSAPVPAPGEAPDELASTVTEVWAQVFGVPVGLDDDFFELGGNSLFAVRIGAAMRERGLPAPRMRELFRNPTVRSVVAGLAAG